MFWYGLAFSGDGCVERVDLDNNGLMGSIPPEIGEILNLKWLVLDSNQLSGPIPVSIGNLSDLEVLSLGFNQLTGSIPVEFQKLTNLKELFLLYNQLSGNIPESMSSLVNLEEVFLNDNQLSGSIPQGIGQLVNMRILHLHRNQLTGTIPSSLGNLADIEELRLDSNQISGIIPESLGNLSKAKLFVLRVNQLTGHIPATLANLSNVELLQLDQNDLTGSIPSTFGSLINLYGLHLYENKLTGEIPPSLGNLTRLKELVLRNNQITGLIPASLGRLSNLIVLQLNNNQLSGCFDEALSPLCSVMYDFTNNPELPWRGDFSRFCAGESQLGATCDDGNLTTTNDQIRSDCGCSGEMNDCSSVTVDISNYTNQSYSMQPGERLFVDLFADSPLPSNYEFQGFGSVNQGTITLGPVPGQFTYVINDNASATIQVPFEICSKSCPDACKSGLVTIQVNRDCFNEENFNLPNILFPDGPAGTNRYFIVETTKLCADLYGESTTALRVFDRWGKVIYRDEDYQNNWSGTDQSGSPLAAGTYYYVLNIQHERGMEQVTGYITLLR